MKKEIALSVNQLGKTYHKSDTERIMALNQIDFDLYKGEILGVIGRNGAGKSTLLKVLSRITPPSSGKIEYEGILTSIIEIGTGFHPDLSGKDNVYLSASLLGHTKKTIDTLYDDIVAFSELEEFMEMPVKHFSSGMYLRLAFAVAFYSKIDILLLDEVIAVGDASFRRKCYQKIRDLRANGTAIILVSHSMESILEFCDRCILLSKGKILTIGKAINVIETYLAAVNQDQTEKGGEENKAVTYLKPISDLQVDSVHFIDFKIKAGDREVFDLIDSNDEITLDLTIDNQGKSSVQIAYELVNINDLRLFLDSYALRENYREESFLSFGKQKISCTIPSGLLSRGIYYVGIIIGYKKEFRKHIEKFAKIKIEESANKVFENEINALLRPKLDWNINSIQ